MSVGEWAAVIGAGAAVAFVLVFVVVAISMKRTLDEVRGTVVDVRHEVVPLLQDGRRAMSTANAALMKTDDLLDTANSVTGTVDSASKLAYNVFSNPLIKGASVASGLLRGAKSFKNLRGGF